MMIVETKVKMNMKQLAKVRNNSSKLMKYLEKRGIDTDKRVDFEAPKGKRYIYFVQKLSKEDDNET